MGQLTDRRAKPALRFGGSFRLIDFPLSNCVNSRIPDVWVIQQYQPQSIEEHLANGRPWDLDRTDGGLLILHPFTGGEEEGFAEGNADAIWRHHRLVEEFAPDVVLVLSADGVYSLDYRDLIDVHLANEAEVTMATTTAEDPRRFGVVNAEPDGAVTDFSYKPDHPRSDVVTMEVFAYQPAALFGVLGELAGGDQPLSDFGDGLLPRLVSRGRAFEYRFNGYWRDVGTLDSYWQAHQDLLSEDGPARDLLATPWPIRTSGSHRPPARIAAGASVECSLLSPGCHVAGRVVNSVLSPGVVVEAGAVVQGAVVLDGAIIRSGTHVTRAIVDAETEVERDAGGAEGGDHEITLVSAD